MASATFQNAFCGKVDQQEYTQIYDFQSYTAESGEWLGRELVTMKVVEKTYRFSGLNYTNAHTTTAQTVTDAAGNSHTVPMQTSFRDGSTGTKVFEVYSCNVQRTPISPRLWNVTVRTRDIEYYVNGTRIVFPNE